MPINIQKKKGGCSPWDAPARSKNRDPNKRPDTGKDGSAIQLKNTILTY